MASCWAGLQPGRGAGGRARENEFGPAREKGREIGKKKKGEKRREEIKFNLEDFDIKYRDNLVHRKFKNIVSFKELPRIRLALGKIENKNLTNS